MEVVLSKWPKYELMYDALTFQCCAVVHFHYECPHKSKWEVIYELYSKLTQSVYKLIKSLSVKEKAERKNDINCLLTLMEEPKETFKLNYFHYAVLIKMLQNRNSEKLKTLIVPMS